MMAVDSLAAHKKTDSCTSHEVLLVYCIQILTCMLLTSVQHIKYGSHAAYEIWVEYST